MKEYIWSGIIKNGLRNNFNHPAPLLEQSDGLQIDLLNAFIDVCMSFKHDKIMVQYFITDKIVTWEEANEAWIKKVIGCEDLSYNVYEGCPTCGPDYETCFEISNHNLMYEIWNCVNEGKYLNIKLTLIEGSK